MQKNEAYISCLIVGFFLLACFLPFALTDKIVVTIPTSTTHCRVVLERPQTFLEFVMFRLLTAIGIFLLILPFLNELLQKRKPT